VINFSPKAKLSKKPAKKARKTSARVPRKPAQKSEAGLTPEDVAEMNMFAAAADKMNWKFTQKNWSKIVAEWKKYQRS